MRILGVEFGTWSLKAVEMESRFRRFDILDIHEVRLPLQILDPTATYRQALEQLMARLPSHPEKIVTSLPPAHTALRFLPIPIKQRKKVEQMFRFELEDNVPFKLDEAIIEHYVTRTKEGSLVFAAIAPKKHIFAHLEWLRSIGIDPDWLTFEGMGLINLYLAQQAEKAAKKEEEAGSEAEPVLLLDVGHLKTNLAIFRQDRLEWFRSIPFGGSSVTQALAMALGVSVEEAERYKMNDLKLDESSDNMGDEAKEALQSAGQAFTPFLTDVSHSMVAYRNLYKAQVSKILLTGGTSKTWGIEKFVSRSLDLPVATFKPYKGMNVKEELHQGDEIRFGEPLGRALVFARKAALLFNFRQQDVAKGTSLTEVSTFLKDPNIIRLLKYAGGLALILLIHVMISSQLASNETKVANEELRKVFSQTFPSVPSKLRMSLTSSPKELKKFIDQKNHELDQKLKMASKARVPVMGLILSITNAFPPDLKVDVNTLQLDDRNFTLEGVVYAGDLNRATEELKKISSLTNVALQRNGQRFTYHGQIVGR